MILENDTSFGLKVNNKKLEYQGRTGTGKILKRGVDAKSGILSWNYQIVVQAPDFVIKGSLVIRDAL